MRFLMAMLSCWLIFSACKWALADDYYAYAGGGMTKALDTSNSDEVEFGGEWGGQGFVGGGVIMPTDVPGLSLRAGGELLYAPKALHGDNSQGSQGKGNTGIGRESSDGKTLQAGALFTTGTVAYAVTDWATVVATAYAGTGYRDDDGAVLAWGASAGAEFPIVDGWTAGIEGRYFDIGGYDAYGPQVKIVYSW